MIRSCPSSHRRRAFSIVELLVALGLLAFVFEQGGELFKAVGNIDRQCAELSDRTSVIDAAIFHLRRDVWGSCKISIPQAHVVELSLPDGALITWRLESDGSLTRQQGNASQHWNVAGKDWQFHAAGPALLVTDTVSPGSQGVLLVSQLLLAGGKP